MSKILKCAQIKNDKPLKLKNVKTNTTPYNLENTNEKLNSGNQAKTQMEEQLELETATKKAEEIIKEAEKEAKNILDKANAQKEDIKRKATEEGYNEGVKKGFDFAYEEQIKLWTAKLQEFNQLRQELFEQNQAYNKYIQGQALKLSLQIAEKIIGDLIREQDERYFTKLIEKGMEKIGEEKDLLIRVAEEDFDKVNIDELYKLKSSVHKINIVKDPTLSSGDCILECNYFKVDCGVHTQVENIKAALKEMDVLADE